MITTKQIGKQLGLLTPTVENRIATMGLWSEVQWVYIDGRKRKAISEEYVDAIASFETKHNRGRTVLPEGYISVCEIRRLHDAQYSKIFRVMKKHGFDEPQKVCGVYAIPIEQYEIIKGEL